LATRYAVTGFDINATRIAEVKSGSDRTGEVSAETLRSVLKSGISESVGLYVTSDPVDLSYCNTYIITVPTPIDRHNRPYLKPLLRASELVGGLLKTGDLVIYESTVYPGATEEDCVPVLERESGLVFNKDFHVGYSPERINPGDRSHTVERIKKITSGSTPQAAAAVDALYASVITAGTHLAPSIRVAEAAKVIENAQRDINIAFVNELKKIFDRMGIDTMSVLAAAATKWNFMPFTPGLVGGHCIGVDPYYLAQKAQEYGYHPEIILAGRRMNDSMGVYMAGEFVKRMIGAGIQIRGASVLVLGITFKENCPDIRNTKVVDLIRELQSYAIVVSVYDPLADAVEVRREYGLELLSALPADPLDGVVYAVSHRAFAGLDISARVAYRIK
jgi:UDP-N-acetyl-D-galactosamine dehydrogenase